MKINLSGLTFEQATTYRDALEADLKKCNSALKAYPKGAFNLTPDVVKATPEWKAQKAAADLAFAKLRAFNPQYVKVFKKELAEARKQWLSRTPEVSV